MISDPALRRWFAYLTSGVLSMVLVLVTLFARPYIPVALLTLACFWLVPVLGHAAKAIDRAAVRRAQPCARCGQDHDDHSYSHLRPASKLSLPPPGGRLAEIRAEWAESASVSELCDMVDYIHRRWSRAEAEQAVGVPVPDTNCVIDHNTFRCPT